nr:antichymotrypsin-1-like [Yponomeuta cagnagella]
MAVKLIAAFAAALVALVSQGCAAPPSFHFIDHEYDLTDLGRSVDQASVKILKEIYAEDKEKNVITSPLGVLLLLSQYAAGTSSSGALRKQIVSALGSADYERLVNDYSGISQRFDSLNGTFLSLANRIYVAQGHELNKQFSQLSREKYNSDVAQLDFSNSQAAADVINKWAEEETRGNIKNAVSPDVLTPDTALALFNVIYFQGHWNVPFEAKETKEKDFHVSKSKMIKKPTMHLVSSLFYHESDTLGARMIELPYRETFFRMVVVLPNEVDGLPSVVDKVAKNGLAEEVFKLAPSGRDINLDMPKFDVDSEINLNGILAKVGLPALFSEAAPGIIEGDSVVVSKAFQKAFVKVDEEGATAGAFTGFVAEYSLSFHEPQLLDFRVDRPFLYAIFYKDIELFVGTVSQ